MSITRNYFYNLIYQFLLIVLPFTLIPYITRALGMEALGVAAFTNSVAQYFVLFGMFGIMLYGNVQIAYVRDDEEKRNQTFWEIFLLQLVMSLISLAAFLTYSLFFAKEYQVIFLLQSVLILANIFDVSWFFTGIEDFKKTVSRSIFAKIISVFLIFLVVKKPEDIWLYVLLLGGMTLIGNIIMCSFLSKFVKKPNFKELNFIKHIRPASSFFIPNLAMRVYFIADKTLLGLLAPISEAGLFDISTKIVLMIMPFISSFSSVMTPRISNVFAKGDIEQIKKYIKKSFEFTFYIAFAVCFGLIAISDKFVIWFLGEEFSKAILIIKICSFGIIIKTIGSITGTQLLISIGRQKQYTISVLTGLAVCIGCNLLLIPSMQAVGASIVFLLTSLAVSGVQVYYCRDYLQIDKPLYIEFIKYLISALVMYVIVVLVSVPYTSSPFITIVQVLSGAFTYILCSYILRIKIFFEGYDRLVKVIKSKYFEQKEMENE